MTLKTLRISEETHTKLKIFCAKNKLKINNKTDEIIYFYDNNKLIGSIGY